jgi:hypothetical protein
VLRACVRAARTFALIALIAWLIYTGGVVVVVQLHRLDREPQPAPASHSPAKAERPAAAEPPATLVADEPHAVGPPLPEVTVDPPRSAVPGERSLTFVSLSLADRWIAQIERDVRLDPDNPRPYLLLGWAHLIKRESRQACGLFAKGLERAARDPELQASAWTGIAESLRVGARVAEADIAQQRAVDARDVRRREERHERSAEPDRLCNGKWG